MSISIIFGTRPEAIKLVPVILALNENPRFKCKIISTAQHRKMLDQVLEIFKIKPDIDLDLMSQNQTLAGFFSKSLTETDKYIKIEKPDLIIVQGDTTTVLSTSLSAFYNKIPIAHIEAGLRTWQKYSPFPEEMNRILTSKLASLHFAPTEWAKRNLIQEGIDENTIFVTGNTVIDSLKLVIDKIEKEPQLLYNSKIKSLVDKKFDGIVLITAHRRESFGIEFESICKAIIELAKRFPLFQFIYPVHLNPNVRETVKLSIGASKLNNVYLLEPLSYIEFVWLMSISTIILTDSGGIQEEAPSLGKPVLVLRKVTERPEAINTGAIKLVGTDTNTIIENVTLLLNDSYEYNKMVNTNNPFGDGNAANKIVDILNHYFVNH